jgi:1,4-dihydroxy-2-naphthoyl-CoA synthase
VYQARAAVACLNGISVGIGKVLHHSADLLLAAIDDEFVEVQKDPDKQSISLDSETDTHFSLSEAMNS